MGEKVYGLLGRKLGHSWSAPIHAALGCADYRLIELEPEELGAFLAREDIGGLNVTIPYKQTVIPLLDGLSPEAARIGAQLCIEDLPRTCLGRNSAELLRIIAPYPEVKICFDTNHLLSEDLLDFVEACGDRIGTVHVSDYDMVDERHWLPGKGKIDWPVLYKALMKAGYKGVFMYELKRGEGSFGDMVAIYEKMASDAAKLK